MTAIPASILLRATTAVKEISSLMEASPTLGAAATEVIAQALMEMANGAEEALDNVQAWVMQQRIELRPLDPDFHVKYETLKAVGAKIRSEKAALNASAAIHPAALSGPTPYAWAHTLVMEGGQTTTRLDFSPSNPFGVRGVDYSGEYEVRSTPLFAGP